MSCNVLMSLVFLSSRHVLAKNFCLDVMCHVKTFQARLCLWSCQDKNQCLWSPLAGSEVRCGKKDREWYGGREWEVGVGVGKILLAIRGCVLVFSTKITTTTQNFKFLGHTMKQLFLGISLLNIVRLVASYNPNDF